MYHTLWIKSDSGSINERMAHRVPLQPTVPRQPSLVFVYAVKYAWWIWIFGVVVSILGLISYASGFATSYWGVFTKDIKASPYTTPPLKMPVDLSRYDEKVENTQLQEGQSPGDEKPKAPKPDLKESPYTTKFPKTKPDAIAPDEDSNREKNLVMDLKDNPIATIVPWTSKPSTKVKPFNFMRVHTHVGLWRMCIESRSFLDDVKKSCRDMSNDEEYVMVSKALCSLGLSLAIVAVSEAVFAWAKVAHRFAVAAALLMLISAITGMVGGIIYVVNGKRIYHDVPFEGGWSAYAFFLGCMSLISGGFMQLFAGILKWKPMYETF